MMMELKSPQEISITPLRVIETTGGSVLHGLRSTDMDFFGFGETYFSEIQHGCIRAWKRHQEMTLNLVVLSGAVRFALYDNRSGEETESSMIDVTLSRVDNFSRLTIPPMIWFGFQGVGKDTNLLTNIANVPHSDTEVERAPADTFQFEW